MTGSDRARQTPARYTAPTLASNPVAQAAAVARYALAYEHDVQLLEVAVNDAHEKYVDTLSKNMPTTVEEWKNRLKLYMQPCQDYFVRMFTSNGDCYDALNLFRQFRKVYWQSFLL